MKKHTNGLFIFRRDLRIEDNTALNLAFEECETVYCAFIFDNTQSSHPYFAYNAFDFMIESIEDLEEQIENKKGHLILLMGDLIEKIDYLVTTTKAKAIYINEDHTPFSITRDKKIEEYTVKKNIILNKKMDALLVQPKDALKKDNLPYTVFTPFYNNIKTLSLREPEIKKGKISDLILKDEIKNLPDKYNISQKRTIKGGRKEALKILSSIIQHTDYAQKRDFPSIDGTTKLSAHLKFGTISVREAKKIMELQLGTEHPLVRQLVWREFYYHIAIHYPYVFGNSFRKEYEKVEWSADEKKFELWKNGKTGFPIVDAGMRELLETGYMHNRVRMITASFLTKDLHVDWRLGEKHFANYLVDYDPCVNNGNWQWAASTGCDAQPYFRIFNPWLQQKKFDTNAEYIKKWVPELKKIDVKIIHDWNNLYDNKTYLEPILEHDVERKITLERFKKI